MLNFTKLAVFSSLAIGTTANAYEYKIYNWTQEKVTVEIHKKAGFFPTVVDNVLPVYENEGKPTVVTTGLYCLGKVRVVGDREAGEVKYFSCLSKEIHIWYSIDNMKLKSEFINGLRPETICPLNPGLSRPMGHVDSFHVEVR